MRIVIDMQGAQTESRFRGIGRYTMAFAHAVVRNRGDHEIILAVSGLFPETIKAIRAAFDGLLPQKNIHVWHAPGPVKEEQPGNDARREAAEVIREAFLASLQPDVIHFTNLFEGYVDDAVTSVGRFDTATPVSVILYDLIPLLNPDHYLKPNPSHERYYLRKVEYLRKVALQLAISEFSRQESIGALGTSDSKTIAISTALDSQFHPQTISDKTASELCTKFGATRPFVLYTGGADERKNLPRLIEAYAALPASLRKAHQLLFAGKMPEGDIVRLKGIARSAGLKNDELLFTGYVVDEELVQLYNLCQLYVFPSWHEGFGLPALEAMACGAPVIGANTASLPEVIGFDEALFDPFDVEAITAKLAQALEDEAYRNHLREHGLHRAKKFSWDDTAKRAIAAWERLPSEIYEERSSWRQIREKLESKYRRFIDSIASNISEQHGDADELLRRMALCLERNEQEIDRYLRPTRLPEKITWRIEGPFDSSYSLALVNREAARALATLGHRVVLHSTEGPGDFPPNEKFLSENPDLAAMHRLSSDVAPIDADIVSRNLYPPRIEDMQARFNFLHAYGWEESGFPLDWVDSFNFSLQGMTVMSEHVRKIMIDHGVTVPISVSSLGFDHWLRVKPDDNYTLKAKSFRFLHVSSCFPRKGADVMLRAYGKAFRASDDVTLVIKTFPNPHNEIHQWLKDARADNAEYPHVIVLEDDYTDAQLKSLYSQCHALVAPSRAEGFGLPMAEAMLSGLAVITTGWSGQTDFCTPETGWLIDYSYARANTHFGLSASVWAEPDENHLAALMKEVFLAPSDVRHARIAAGQRLLNKNFKWSHSAQRMIKAAHSFSQRVETKEPRIGWVSTWNTRCGIAAYSEHLISNMPADVTVLAAHGKSRIGEDGSNVSRCWSAGEHDDLMGLVSTIEKYELDTLVIQFNYGFFNLETFGEFLTNQLLSNRTVVVTMHATIDPVQMPHKKLSLLAPALSRCQRVLVHSPNDMNRLKQLGLVENVTLFPHGIIDYTPSLTTSFDNNRPFVVASYGFFLPHKGLLELIDAVAMLHSRGINIRLNMVNAVYPASESAKTLRQAIRKIETAGMQEVVSLCTEFLSDSESLEKLAGADLIVFPYQKTGESSSAAVRYGLASRRPVAVTPLNIFEDVEKAVHFLPGKSPESIADGIGALMAQIIDSSELLRNKEKSAERWRGECGYQKIANRLYGMLTGLRHD
ncbi:glycosyltransferase [Spiribacter sp. 221]|uniref:glycosyltransferase n=1 Tax=Spiribacter onubensis TaxID=3122420 RepID=UPI00349FAE13